MMDFITGSEYDSDAESARNQRTNAKVDREISKLESENKAYSNKIAEAREGYNKTFSDKRSQDSLINSRNKEKAEKELKLAIKSLDNAKSKGLVHKNKVDREKSRLTLKVNNIETK